jgi:hypothetical protein
LLTLTPNRLSPIAARWEVKSLLGPENSDDTLGVYNRIRYHPAVGLFEWNRMDLQELGGIVTSVPTGYESLSQKKLDGAGRESNRGIEGAQFEQPAGAKSDLLLAFPPGGCDRAFAVIDNAGRDLINGPLDGRPILPNQVDSAIVIDRHDCNSIRRTNDVTDRLSAIGQDNRLLLG